MPTIEHAANNCIQLLALAKLDTSDVEVPFMLLLLAPVEEALFGAFKGVDVADLLLLFFEFF